MFIHVFADNPHHPELNRYEWGYHSEIVPAVGDIIWLAHGFPGDDWEDFWDMVTAKVVRREFCFHEEEDVTLFVEPERQIPAGHVADSPEWPAKDVKE